MSDLWGLHTAAEDDDYRDSHRLSHYTAATDGIRYAHIVDADVAEDLRRLAVLMPEDLEGVPIIRLLTALDWHSHDDERQRIQVKDKIPADPSWLEPTDANYQHPIDPETGEEFEDWDEWLNATKSPDYDPTPRFRGTTFPEVPRQRTWYHVSPYEMNPGDVLVPGKNKSYDSNRGIYTPPGGGQHLDDEYENPLDLPPYDNHTRHRHVWMAPKLTPTAEEIDRYSAENIRYPFRQPSLLERRRDALRSMDEYASTWATRFRHPQVNNGAMHVYEVRPSTHPRPWNMVFDSLGWAAPSARVVRKVPEHEWNIPLEQLH